MNIHTNIYHDVRLLVRISRIPDICRIPGLNVRCTRANWIIAKQTIGNKRHSGMSGALDLDTIDRSIEPFAIGLRIERVVDEKKGGVGLGGGEINARRYTLEEG